MLSFGMENERAFSIAFCSARLFAGSPPPSFAATMIARDSLEKSLPRLASAAPFLCLIDDHLLCPDNARLLPDEIQEPFVQPRVVGELRMERGDEEATLACEHRPAVDLGEHFDAGPDLVDPRRANEHRPDRHLLAAHGQVRLERRHLTSERVSPDREVDQAEVIAVEDDHARAGAEDRARELRDGPVEPVEAHQPHERGGLTAGDHEPVEAVELLGLPHLDHVRVELAQHPRMLAKVPLHGENADPKRLHDAMVSTAFGAEGPPAGGPSALAHRG